MDRRHITTSISELLHPELMSDERLRTILEERGAEELEEMGHWQLKDMYDALVLPKPNRELDPNRRTTQILLQRRQETAAAWAERQFMATTASEMENNLKRSRADDLLIVPTEAPSRKIMKMSSVGNGECDMVNVNATVSVSANLSGGRKRSKDMGSNDPVGAGEEPPTKKRHSPIRFP